MNCTKYGTCAILRFILAVPRGCLRFVIVVFPGHTHLLFLSKKKLELEMCPWDTDATDAPAIAKLV